MFRWITLILTGTFVALSYTFWDSLYVQMVTGALVGIFGILLLFALLSPLFRETLKYNPEKPGWYQYMSEVPQHRTVTINKGGRPLYCVRGDEPPVHYYNSILWRAYQWYIMTTIGLHIFLPFFTAPTTKQLQRRIATEAEGKWHIDDKSDKSDHVRTATTEWPLELKGIYIGAIPVIVKMQISYHNRRGPALDQSGNRQPTERNRHGNVSETEALQWEMVTLFRVNNWATTLDQAINSVARGVFAGEAVSLDDVLDRVPQELWEEYSRKLDPADEEESTYAKVGALIHHKLDRWGAKSTGWDGQPVTLHSLGLVVESVDILAFSLDELTEEEQVKLRSGAGSLQEARGESLRGKGQKEAQAALLSLYGKEHTAAMIQAQALQQSVEGSDLVSTLLTLLARQVNNKNGE